MQWLVDYISSLFSTWASIFSLIFSAFKGLADIVLSLPDLLQTVTASISGLPSILATFIVSTITISVVYLVLGRGQGGD